MNQSFFIQELTALRKLLDENTIGIVIGDRLNLDTAASALALFLSLKESGKKVQIISKKEPYVEISNLVGIDKVKSSFSGDSNKVVVSLPYNKGEIGKVSYKEEQDRINFYLTAADGRSISPYDTKDINLIWEGASPSVIIAFGVQSAMQIGEFADSNSVRVVNIDNGGESFGDVKLVDSSLSSSSEIVAKIIKELRLPINIDIAQNLLDGILYATRNFTKPNTSALAFEGTGLLMQIGAIRSDNRNQGRGNSFPQPNRQKDRNQPRLRPYDNMQSETRNEEVAKPKVEEARDASIQNMNNNEDVNKAPAHNDIPNDWLMPKVFKGSQDINDLK